MPGNELICFLMQDQAFPIVKFGGERKFVDKLSFDQQGLFDVPGSVWQNISHPSIIADLIVNSCIKSFRKFKFLPLLNTKNTLHCINLDNCMGANTTIGCNLVKNVKLR